MRIDRICLNGFRNYDYQWADFAPGINVITGENAQGKTNLLEAVCLLSTGRSFRTRFDKELVHFDYSAGEILADLHASGRKQTVKITLRPGVRKIISVNANRVTAGELAGKFTCVLFCPDDLNLIKEGPGARRRLMDTAITQLRPGYGKLVTDYNRLYDQKAAILRDWREKPSLLDTLDDFSDRMCKVSAQIIRYRAAFTARLAVEAKRVHEEFSGGRDTLDLKYHTVSTVKDPAAPALDIYYDLCEHQESHRKAELDSGQCLTGCHKDDINIFINEKLARSFASQGQTRTAALSLKLAEREIHLQESGEYPVLLLDDVLSELDPGRQEFVLNRIGGGQTLITCCEGEEISRRTGGKVITVQNGEIK